MPRAATHPEPLPRCPGCAGDVELYQPLETEPVRLVGVCTNDDCRVVTIFDLRPNGLWIVRQRMVAPPVDRPISSATLRLRARAGAGAV